MTENRQPIATNWEPDDDAPELTPALARRAQLANGGKVVREATGTVTRRGRPPIGRQAKQQVTLRLASTVIDHFKQSGSGWQTRLNAVLERHVEGTGSAVTQKPSKK